MSTETKPRIIPTPKQLEAIRAIKRGVRYILTGGAISTAKSYGLAQIFISMAMQFPRTRYGIFRKNLTVLKRTTYQTFRKVAFEYGLVEGQHYKVNRSEMYWEFNNGTQIFFLELDETKDPDFNKVKGLELTAAGIDEMNEVVKEGWLIVGSRVGRENRNGEPQFVLGTCNPADNWVKDTFYTPWIKGTLPADFAFIPSLPKDNPHNSQDYLEALDRMPPQFKKRYVEGNCAFSSSKTAAGTSPKTGPSSCRGNFGSNHLLNRKETIMQRYDWEATAYSPELGQRIWLQYGFELDGEDAKAAETKAHRQAEQRADEEGCDPSTIEDLTVTLTDCDHADFEENPMDGSAVCLTCGKRLKGLSD